MSHEKFSATERALNAFEKLYGDEVRQVFRIANGHISRELTDGMIAGVPQKVLLEGKKIRVVPIILTPKAGGYGEIGSIIIDAIALNILGSTTRVEVLQNAEALFNAKAKAA